MIAAVISIGYFAACAMPITGAEADVAATAGGPAQILQVNKFWDDNEWKVLALTNKTRLAHGLLPLSTIELLQTVSEIRTNELTVSTSHIRPDGRKCFTVFDDFNAHTPGYYGENLAAGLMMTPEVVFEAWMNSPKHKEHILSSEYARMGVGYTYRDNDIYGNYWEQMFTSASEITSTSIGMVSPRAKIGTISTIDDLGLVLIQYSYGEVVGYMPIVSEMCSVCAGAETGYQRVIVKYGDLAASFDVALGGPVSNLFRSGMISAYERSEF